MLNDWLLDAFRFTIFFTQSADRGSESWFEDVTGSVSETTEIRRVEGVRIDTALIAGARHTLSVGEARADWNISVEPGDDDALKAGLGSANQLAKRFELFKPWLAHLREVNRVAIGVVAKAAADDRPSAYRILASYLPSLKLDPEGSTELLYRINRPKIYNISEDKIKINRLSSWSTILVRRLSQEVRAGDEQVMSSGRVTTVGHWARCELDINTDAEHVDEFSPVSLRELPAVLVSSASEILDRGDFT